MKKIKLAVEIASGKVDGVRTLGGIYGMDLAKSTRKIVKDYIEFYVFAQGTKIDVDRAKYEDIADYDSEITGISVPVKEYYHKLFKQICKNQDLKMKHVVRGLFHIYGNQETTKKYNFEDQNILLEEWKRGHV